MARYIKYCPICGTEFLAERIGATYCAKKCRSKAAKFNASMLDILVKGAMARTKTLESMPKVVRDYIEHEAKNVENLKLLKQTGQLVPLQEELTTKITESMFLDNHEKAVVLQEALEIKRKREIELLEKRFAEESKKDSNLEYINTTDPAVGNADGFGMVEEQHNSNGNNNNGNIPKKSGLRRIGGIK